LVVFAIAIILSGAIYFLCFYKGNLAAWMRDIPSCTNGIVFIRKLLGVVLPNTANLIPSNLRLWPIRSTVHHIFTRKSNIAKTKVRPIVAADGEERWWGRKMYQIHGEARNNGQEKEIEWNLLLIQQQSVMRNFIQFSSEESAFGPARLSNGWSQDWHKGNRHSKCGRVSRK
jgi:hypothetical protein